jgi:hypothetical protein
MYISSWHCSFLCVNCAFCPTRWAAAAPDIKHAQYHRMMKPWFSTCDRFAQCDLQIALLFGFRLSSNFRKSCRASRDRIHRNHGQIVVEQGLVVDRVA